MNNGSQDIAFGVRVSPALRAAVAAALREGRSLDWRRLAQDDLLAELRTLAPAPVAGAPYGRVVLASHPGGEAVLFRWRPATVCAAHDHAESAAEVCLLEGVFRERRYAFDGQSLTVQRTQVNAAPCLLHEPVGIVHDVSTENGGLALHVYRPGVRAMRVYDVTQARTLTVGPECGAWVPQDPALIVSAVPWATSVGARFRMSASPAFALPVPGRLC